MTVEEVLKYKEGVVPFGSHKFGSLMKPEVLCQYFKRKVTHFILNDMMSMRVNVLYRQQQKRKTPDIISVLFINRTGSRWEGMGRLKEEAMAFNFLKGARPATPLQLLFIRWPVIPSGLCLVSGYRLSFKQPSCHSKDSVRTYSIPLLYYLVWLSCTLMSLQNHRLMSRGPAVEV